LNDGGVRWCNKQSNEGHNELAPTRCHEGWMGMWLGSGSLVNHDG
jgi:hypothetical protein